MLIEKDCKYCSAKFFADDRKIYSYCGSLCRSKDKFIPIYRNGKKISVWKLNYNKYKDFYDSIKSDDKNINKCYVCENVYTGFRMCCSKECSVLMKEQTTLISTGAKHNLSSNSLSRKNMENKMMEEHGINNVFQRPDVKLKLKETWEIKYGYDNPSKSDIIKKKKRDKLEKNGYWLPRDEWDEKKIYDANLYEITWSQMKKYGVLKFGKDIWEKIRESRDFMQKDWLTVDHRISRIYGFINKIPPNVIGHICNLEIMTFEKNRDKWAKCSITIDELIEEIEKFEEIIIK